MRLSRRLLPAAVLCGRRPGLGAPASAAIAVSLPLSCSLRFQSAQQAAPAAVPLDIGPSSRVRPHAPRETIAVAAEYKYDLAKIVTMAEAGQLPCRLSLAFPHPKTFSETRLTIPLEIVVLSDGHGGDVSIFNDGSYVSFGMPEEQLDDLVAQLKSAELHADEVAWRGQAATVHRARYTSFTDLPGLGYETPADVKTSYIDEGPLDAIVLRDDTLESKLPFMFCLARRVQVDAIQQSLKPIIEGVRKWRMEVAAKGNLPFEIKECRVRRARVMRLVAAQSRIAARPRIFTDGDHSHLRHMYGLTCYYFELHEKNDALRVRLERATDTLRYLGDEAKARTNHRLEWVIIALIGGEIVVHLAQAHDASTAH
jgi:uncharacterized Rmd1/YagE family protein